MLWMEQVLDNRDRRDVTPALFGAGGAPFVEFNVLDVW